MKGSPHVSVDVESNGRIQGYHSMISFGMVIVEPGFKRSFYTQLKPVTEFYEPEALAVSGFTFEQTKEFTEPALAMQDAADWLAKEIQGRPIFWSDNNGYDAAWINWYFNTYLGHNPFGHSSRRIADFISGVELDLRYRWKHKRKTKHTHHPVDDAKGNAEVLLDYFLGNNIRYL